MAASRMVTCWLIYLIFYLFAACFFCVNAYSGFLSRDVITKWAELLQNRLLPELDKFTGIKKLEKSYDDLHKAKLVKVDGFNLVHKMSRDLTKNLEKKLLALEKLVAAAEESVRNHKYDPSISVDDVPFVKMREFTENDPNLVYSEKFKRTVNYTYSGVHIPIEIYEGYPEILNGLQWSSTLDTVFRENMKNDPDLMWQYFGSTTGFMRTYPANRWIAMPRKPDYPDLFDVRLRPWYVHASTSPKDMLILMDASGSMHGQTMEIMKIAVKSLLTTLDENDFVNIASFSNIAKWVTCFDTFVQATRRNKQILSKGIDSIIDGNRASLSLGLEFAFSQFANFHDNKSEPWAGSDCNQVIMLFSDGGTEEAWEVLEKYNANKTIRVFTYAVGPHPVPYATLKEIACSNRGFFTAIPAMGAIRTKIQDYVKVLGRTLVLSDEKAYQWTNFYLDAMDLGMMTTVTLPVFNKTEGGNQTMVGVMGIDITLQQMLDYEPSYEIGPAGYSFGINSNGFVVFHPNLKTDYEFMDDPPHLDFLEVEIETSGKQELRRSMIKLETSKKSVTSLLKMPNGKHIVRHHMEYYYTPLNKTTFSIAIVMSTDRSHYLLVEGMNFNEVLPLEENEVDGMHLAPWKYCYGYILKSNVSESLKNLSETLRDNPELCKIPLLQRLIWDIRKTEEIIRYWQTEQQNKKRDGVISTFVQSEGGLTRIYPPSESFHLHDQMNPSKSLVFQRAFFGDDYVFLPPNIEYDSALNQTQDAVIMIVKSVSFTRTTGINYKPAVVGVLVDPLWLQPYLLSTPTGPGVLPVSCSDVDEVICYLVDDGGFVISTNQPDLWNVLGKFLGVVDSEIMTELYENKIYLRNEEFNYEDRCKKERKVSAGFRTSPLPFHSTLSTLNLGWLFDLSAWSHLKYWLLSFFSSMWIPRSDALPEFFELPNETICNTHEAQYYLGRWGRSYSGDIYCNNCTRHYALAKVGRMNILLLVTTKSCAPFFCDPVPPLLQASEEISVSTTESSTCEQPLRYRQRPAKCHAYSTEENNSECGSVGTLALPHLALFLELICLLAVTKLVHSTENMAAFVPASP